MKPILQLALDFVDLSRALRCAQEAVTGGVDWLEAGTPLIKAEGLGAVRRLREEFPRATLVADMKIMDAGRIEVEAAAKSGANIVGVLGAASDETIKECIEAARNYGCKLIVDLIGVKDVVRRAKEAERFGADYIGIHCAIDEQMKGKNPFQMLKEVSGAVGIPVAVAGGINSETVVDAVKSGASIIVVGGAITKSKDAAKAARQIKLAMATFKVKESKLYKRSTDVRKILGAVSSANLSDALHRAGALSDIHPITGALKAVGEVLTVRTYPGDWAKPVEAIDLAKPGDIIVIDAGGVGPAVWGELATHSAKKRRLAGVVIYGAIRDVEEIRKLKFPAWARLVMSAAGEPRGFGEIGVPINIGGVCIDTGDWLLCDDDGCVLLPKEKAVEYANRAQDVLEREMRLRAEIEAGRTLSSVTELLKWEKR